MLTSAAEGLERLAEAIAELPCLPSICCPGPDEPMQDMLTCRCCVVRIIAREVLPGDVQ